MSIYQIIKDFGKRTLLVAGGLVSVLLSGCDQSPMIITQILDKDVNGDGRKDVINYTLDYGVNGSYNIYVESNKFDGTFADSKKVLRLERGITNLRVEDLDGDKKLDILYAMFDPLAGWGVHGSWDIHFAKGYGDGTFQNPVKIKHYENEPQ